VGVNVNIKKEQIEEFFKDIENNLKNIITNYKMDVNLINYYDEKLLKEKIFNFIGNYGLKEKKDIFNILFEIKDEYKNNKKLNVSISLNTLTINNKKNDDDFIINLTIPLKEDNLKENLSKIITFLNKKRINYLFNLSNTLTNNAVRISLTNNNDAKKVVDFIKNDKDISKDLYDVNPLYITDGKVILSSKCMLIDQLNILDKYICDYIVKSIVSKKTICFSNFENYIQASLIDFEIQFDLSTHIKLSGANGGYYDYCLVELQNILFLTATNLRNIENENDFTKIFYNLNNELTKKENIEEKLNKFKDFSYKSMLENKELENQLIITMTNKYGQDSTKKAIRSYCDIVQKDKNSILLNYVTRENGLREKVRCSRSFRTYLNLHREGWLDSKFEELSCNFVENLENIKSQKEVILEQVCKETYLAALECDSPAKIQVAMLLLKMKKNNYDYITRKNNARKIAKENIKPEEVKELIKKSLEANGYIFEDNVDLYSLYASHIEHICEYQKRKKEL